MSNAKQKPEMTVEEFIEKWGIAKIMLYFDKDEIQIKSKPIIKEGFPSDLRSVIRGMLIKYEEYMNGGDDYIDKFLNENWIE